MTKCHECGQDSVGSSPTGAWCNNCGWADPCECHKGGGARCDFHRRKAALEGARDRDKPLPPEVLANALQDRIHPASGRLIAAKPVKRGREG